MYIAWKQNALQIPMFETVKNFISYDAKSIFLYFLIKTTNFFINYFNKLKNIKNVGVLSKF